MYLTTDSKRSLAQRIARAIAHVRQVSVREHIKANRFDRVNHFLTSLRRELIGWGSLSVPSVKDAKQTLLKKATWYDVGIPAITEPQLEEILRMANSYMGDVENQAQEIQLGLQLANSDLRVAEGVVRQAAQINELGQGVLTSIQDLFA